MDKVFQKDVPFSEYRFLIEVVEILYYLLRNLLVRFFMRNMDLENLVVIPKWNTTAVTP